MIALSAEAENHVDRLIEHFEEKGRVEAALALVRALEHAKERICAVPEAGLAAPRPYPTLKKPGRRSKNLAYAQKNWPTLDYRGAILDRL